MKLDEIMARADEPIWYIQHAPTRGIFGHRTLWKALEYAKCNDTLFVVAGEPPELTQVTLYPELLEMMR